MPDIKDRLTVIDQIYHQQQGQQPTQVESRYVRELETSDQPYCRRTEVGEDWKSLDFGWLKDGVGTFVIQNEEGKGLSQIPSVEEKEEIAKHVLELSVAETPAILVRPGESVRVCPLVACVWQIRSQYKSSKYVLNAFPM